MQTKGSPSPRVLNKEEIGSQGFQAQWDPCSPLEWPRAFPPLRCRAELPLGVLQAEVLQEEPHPGRLTAVSVALRGLAHSHAESKLQVFACFLRAGGRSLGPSALRPFRPYPQPIPTLGRLLPDLPVLSHPGALRTLCLTEPSSFQEACPQCCLCPPKALLWGHTTPMSSSGASSPISISAAAMSSLLCFLSHLSQPCPLPPGPDEACYSHRRPALLRAKAHPCRAPRRVQWGPPGSPGPPRVAPLPLLPCGSVSEVDTVGPLAALMP